MGSVEDRLSTLVSDALKNELRDTSNMNFPFMDAGDYKKKTGKRFRRTKAQINAGLTKEQAFQEFMESIVEKN
tara:strand:+ start:107172 stop:107390 length:219 start_codon:yes stop_codon:yes gene_type:complete